MGTIAEFESLLAKCEVVLCEHEETRTKLDSLPDSEEKRELMESFAQSLRVAVKAEKETREALNQDDDCGRENSSITIFLSVPRHSRRWPYVSREPVYWTHAYNTRLPSKVTTSRGLTEVPNDVSNSPKRVQRSGEVRIA